MYYFKVRGVLCKGMLSPLWNKQDSSRRKASSRLLPDLHSLPRPEPCSTRGMQLYHHRLKRITTNKHWITTKKKKPHTCAVSSIFRYCFFWRAAKAPSPTGDKRDTGCLRALTGNAVEPSGSHTGSLTQQRESHAASHTWLFPLKGKEWQMRALGAHVVREEGLHREKPAVKKLLHGCSSSSGLTKWMPASSGGNKEMGFRAVLLGQTHA